MKNSIVSKLGDGKVAAAKRKPNTAKGKSYALAYDMIRAAMEKDCPLQAIAIEESIITDRLSSTLNVGIRQVPST